MGPIAFVSGSTLLQHRRFSRIQLSPRHAITVRTFRIPRIAQRTSCSALQPAERSPPAKHGARVAALAIGTVVCTVFNRVAHRMQLTGVMKYYTFFIGQGATLAYALIYSLVLAARVRTGIVPGKQVYAARTAYLPYFAAIGVLEAIAFSLQLYAAARLPGVLIGVLAQVILPFTMVASFVLLRKRYSFTQVLGVMCVIAGVLTCTIPSASVSALAGENIVLPAALFACACAIVAFVIVLKEQALRGGQDSSSKDRGQQFDVFIVNSFGSVFQCLATLALLPVTLALATTLPPMEYITGGFTAFFTAPYMPWLTVLYIICSVSLNVFYLFPMHSLPIVALSLVKQTSASVALLANLFSVPLVSLVFCLKLPLLTPSPFSWTICAGLAIIVFGVLLYNRRSMLTSTSRSSA